ncbi:hypothetical protein Bbelb_442560 [Branchiostoma belcheri]|nr:hypothetical protein Bbelb_442560 [Branchiostoma belcheri]
MAGNVHSSESWVTVEGCCATIGAQSCAGRVPHTHRRYDRARTCTGRQDGSSGREQSLGSLAGSDQWKQTWRDRASDRNQQAWQTGRTSAANGDTGAHPGILRTGKHLPHSQYIPQGVICRENAQNPALLSRWFRTMTSPCLPHDVIHWVTRFLSFGARKRCETYYSQQLAVLKLPARGVRSTRTARPPVFPGLGADPGSTESLLGAEMRLTATYLTNSVRNIGHKHM